MKLAVLRKSQDNPLLSIILGATFFFLFIGPQTLNPMNVSWLQFGDPAQHYYGWAFFRYGPWLLPLGLNPNFGIDMHSSIVYTDSIPLVAILLKPLSWALSEPFQYLGMFVLGCFLLQAYFSWKLSQLITKSILLQSLIICFFISAPIMVGRTFMTTSLTAHFLILAALYLSLRKNQDHRIRDWAILLCCASLIHFYIFAMVAAVWFGDFLDKRLRERLSSVSLATFQELCFIFFLVLASCWVAGYFVINISSGSPGNYGLNTLNLASLIDPQGWSYLYQGSGYNFHTGDGFNYLGVGYMALFFLAFITLIISRQRMANFYNHTFLFLSLVGLTLFAISHHVRIGSYEAMIPFFPESLARVASLLRASGRMFWPVYYAILFCVFTVICKSYSKKKSCIIIGFFLIMQLIDTSAGWLQRRQRVSDIATAAPISVFENPFWSEAAKKYTSVIRVPPQNTATGWEMEALYASRYRLKTNAANFSRFDVSKLFASGALIQEEIKSGSYNPSQLYFIEDSQVIPVLAHLNEKRDLLALIDGFVILAPAWNQCNDCVNNLDLFGLSSKHVAPFNKKIFFTSQNPYTPFYLVDGWSRPEVWGTWMDGPSAKLNLLLPLERVNLVNLDIQGFFPPSNAKVSAELWVNGEFNQALVLSKDLQNTISIPVNDHLRNLGFLSLEFRSKNSTRPLDLGVGDDARSLSLGVISAIFK